MSIPKRIQELRSLIGLALSVKATDEPLYNSICRSISVLIASHLEGFLKETSKGVVQDLNYHLGSFSKMPPAMQRTFCRNIAFYEGVPGDDIENRIKQLLAFFSKNSVLIDMGAFTYKQNQNKNPSADFIDSVFTKMGMNSILYSIAGGRFDVVFNNEKGTNFIILKEMAKLRSRLYAFPYRKFPSAYQFNHKLKPKKGDPLSLWHTFIEEMLTRRHSVAHGDSMSNETTAEALQFDVLKLEVLMHAVLFSSATFFSGTMEVSQ